MRASFEGDYLQLPAGCTSAASRRRREAYLRGYRGKRYTEAFAGMQAFVGECGEFLNWLDRDRFANDRALTLLRLNRPQVGYVPTHRQVHLVQSQALRGGQALSMEMVQPCCA